MTCRWCLSRPGGCLSCNGAPTTNTRDVSPDLPEPLLTIKFDGVSPDSDGMRVMRAAFGREAIDKAFSPGGGGIDEIKASIEHEQAAIAAERDESC